MRVVIQKNRWHNRVTARHCVTNSSLILRAFDSFSSYAQFNTTFSISIIIMEGDRKCVNFNSADACRNYTIIFLLWEFDQTIYIYIEHKALIYARPASVHHHSPPPPFENCISIFNSPVTSTILVVSVMLSPM